MRPLVDDSNVHDIKDALVGVLAFVCIIWIFFILDRFLPLESLALVPRSLGGLTGIVAMPFLHVDWQHIVSNTAPLLVTLLLLAGSRANTGMIVILIVLLSGILLWVFGREARHMGASALVFGLIGFHLTCGILERRLVSLLIAACVGIVYGTTLLQGIVPFQRGVSWEGHLLGALAGALVAMSVARNMTQRNVST